MGFSFNEILQTKMLTKLEENVNFLKLKPKSAKKARSQQAASPLAIAATYSVHAGQQAQGSFGRQGGKNTHPNCEPSARLYYKIIKPHDS